MPDLLSQSKTITSPEQQIFHIGQTAWYSFNITVRVKSEKQRGEHETDDEELTIQLDEFTFPKPHTSNDLKDAPAAFNGGAQHNQEKTVRIICVLNQGDHTLKLTPQYQAEIASISYEPLTLNDDRISLKLNEQSVHRDQQPWITFALVSQHFTQVTIKAKVWWHFFNGDDLQVKINGNIIPHLTNTKRHKHWVFHARAIWDVFGREQMEALTLSKPSLSTKVSYVELCADRTPLLMEITFVGEDLGKDIALEETNSLQLHQYSSGLGGVNFNRYDQYIFDVVNNINNEFSHQNFPPIELLDPNLIKAMMYVESKVGHYKAPEGNYPADPDVMQIADPRNPAIHTLNHDGWIDPSTGKEAQEYMWTPEGIQIINHSGKAEVSAVTDSIYWGAIWLYHKAEIIHENGNRSWRTWKEAVNRYNGGGDSDYVKKVYDIYEKGDWK